MHPKTVDPYANPLKYGDTLEGIESKLQTKAHELLTNYTEGGESLAKLAHRSYFYDYHGFIEVEISLINLFFLYIRQFQPTYDHKYFIAVLIADDGHQVLVAVTTNKPDMVRLLKRRSLDLQTTKQVGLLKRLQSYLKALEASTHR